MFGELEGGKDYSRGQEQEGMGCLLKSDVRRSFCLSSKTLRIRTACPSRGTFVNVDVV